MRHLIGIGLVLSSLAYSVLLVPTADGKDDAATFQRMSDLQHEHFSGPPSETLQDTPQRR